MECSQVMANFIAETDKEKKSRNRKSLNNQVYEMMIGDEIRSEAKAIDGLIMLLQGVNDI